MVQGWHGQPFDKPLTRVRETTQILRQVLAGEKTDFAGSTASSKGYRQPASDVPIFLAGLRSKMLETAAEYGDGVVLNLWPNRALEKIMGHISVGAERAGKALEDVEVINRHQICVTDDVAAGRDKFRAAFGGYFATSVYNDFLAWAGFEAEAKNILDAWKARDRDGVAKAFTDELVDELALIGPVEAVVERLRDCGSRGIDTHIFSTFAGYPKQEYDRVVKALAECWNR
jgi:alkanesulfonate monooxygenase SsuD/methylene tetrahydromethanopterin reductase-like flavin-dependent oxidoreductase (luciferase family)